MPKMTAELFREMRQRVEDDLNTLQAQMDIVEAPYSDKCSTS